MKKDKRSNRNSHDYQYTKLLLKLEKCGNAYQIIKKIFIEKLLNKISQNNSNKNKKIIILINKKKNKKINPLI